jgi:hypothetical protein
MEIKDAVRNAMEFAVTSLGAERTVGIRLEEVESSRLDDRPVWFITLSSVSNPSFRPIFGQIGADAEREYKTFTVDKETGEVLAMKIRLLAVPTL